MHPERWPGEPLINRLTLSEIDEVERYYLRRDIARRRRARWEITHGRKVPVKRYDLQGRRLPAKN